MKLPRMTRLRRVNLYHGTRCALAHIALIGVIAVASLIVTTPLHLSPWETGITAFLLGFALAWIVSRRILHPMIREWGDAAFVASEPLDMEQEGRAYLAEETFEKALREAYGCRTPMIFSRKDTDGHIDVWSRYREEIDAAQKQRQLHRERGFE